MIELKSGHARKLKESRASVNAVQLTENLFAGMALTVTSSAIYLNVTWVCKKYHRSACKVWNLGKLGQESETGYVSCKWWQIHLKFCGTKLVCCKNCICITAIELGYFFLWRINGASYIDASRSMILMHACTWLLLRCPALLDLDRSCYLECPKAALVFQTCCRQERLSVTLRSLIF